MTNLVKLALDIARKNYGTYSASDMESAFIEKLRELNGNSDKLSMSAIKTFRAHPELYGFVEELIDVLSIEALSENDFYGQMVEQKVIGVEDLPVFHVQKNSHYVVANCARGTQGIRRQRIHEDTDVVLRPEPHAVKVYDEMIRLLAGKVSVAQMVEDISRAIARAQLNDVFAAWNNLTSAELGTTFAPAAGTYIEDALLTLSQKVSAANDGAEVYFVTTLNGARAINASDGSEIGKEDIYNYGYKRKWNGIDVFIVPQRFVEGTTTFMFNDKVINILPRTTDKPIKQVLQGDTYMNIHYPEDNADLSVDAVAIANWATGFVTGMQYGKYTLS